VQVQVPTARGDVPGGRHPHHRELPDDRATAAARVNPREHASYLEDRELLLSGTDRVRSSRGKTMSEQLERVPMRRRPIKSEWVSAFAAVAGVVIGVAGGVIGVHYSNSAKAADARSEQAVAAENVRNAREAAVSEALQVAAYGQEDGVGHQNEIDVLAADIEQLVDDYGQSRLKMSATFYRLVAQNVTYWTTDLGLADRLLDRADHLAGPGSLERVQVARVRGDLAAQRQQPDVMAQAYDDARRLATELTEPEPAVDDYTRVYRLVDAYLGAKRSEMGSEARRGFCRLAHRWSSKDHQLVEDFASRALVRGQLNRVGVPVDQLASICS
jgi:hypothetical protein